MFCIRLVVGHGGGAGGVKVSHTSATNLAGMTQASKLRNPSATQRQGGPTWPVAQTGTQITGGGAQVLSAQMCERRCHDSKK